MSKTPTLNLQQVQCLSAMSKFCWMVGLHKNGNSPDSARSLVQLTASFIPLWEVLAIWTWLAQEHPAPCCLPPVVYDCLMSIVKSQFPQPDETSPERYREEYKIFAQMQPGLIEEFETCPDMVESQEEIVLPKNTLVN